MNSASLGCHPFPAKAESQDICFAKGKEGCVRLEFHLGAIGGQRTSRQDRRSWGGMLGYRADWRLRTQSSFGPYIPSNLITAGRYWVISTEYRHHLVVQWLRLCAANAGDMGSIPGQGTKIPYVVQGSQTDKNFKKYAVCSLKKTDCNSTFN